jgi:hypothetical protein
MDSSAELRDIDVAVAPLGQVGEALDRRAHVLDPGAVVAPLDDHLVADPRGVDVDRGHREHFAEEVAVDRPGRDADPAAVLDDVIGMRLRPHVRRVGQIERLVGLARAEQRRPGVDHVVVIPPQRDDRPLRIRDLRLERVAAEEVVIEFAHVVPADLDGRAIARSQVVRIDAARDLEGVADVGRGEVIGHRRGDERPGDLRESPFDVIDEIGSPSQTLDAELLARLVNGVVDLRAVLDRSV